MARLVLRSFDPPWGGSAEDGAAGTSAGEEARLAAFEAGYKAGWDDSASYEAGEQARIRADLARNLQLLSFTYHEARSAVLTSLAPLLHEIVARVLPELARETLAETVVARLLPLAASAAEVPVEVICSAEDKDTLSEALAGQDLLPVEITVDPFLVEGQVQLRFGSTEEMIDLDGAIAAIANAVTAFFTKDLPKEHRTHG